MIHCLGPNPKALFLYLIRNINSHRTEDVLVNQDSSASIKVELIETTKFGLVYEISLHTHDKGLLVENCTVELLDKYDGNVFPLSYSNPLQNVRCLTFELDKETNEMKLNHGTQLKLKVITAMQFSIIVDQFDLHDEIEKYGQE